MVRQEPLDALEGGQSEAEMAVGLERIESVAQRLVAAQLRHEVGRRRHHPVRTVEHDRMRRTEEHPLARRRILTRLPKEDRGPAPVDATAVAVPCLIATIQHAPDLIGRRRAHHGQDKHCVGKFDRPIPPQVNERSEEPTEGGAITRLQAAPAGRRVHAQMPPGERLSSPSHRHVLRIVCEHPLMVELGGGERIEGVQGSESLGHDCPPYRPSSHRANRSRQEAAVRQPQPHPPSASRRTTAGRRRCSAAWTFAASVSSVSESSIRTGSWARMGPPSRSLVT